MTPVLLDARPGGLWAQGHFAGALDADLDRVLSTANDPGFDPTPLGRHPLPPVDRWSRQLGLWGIGPRTPVLVYDGVQGEMGACRLWWMLKASGHDAVDVLDGGIPAGLAAGWSWTTDPGTPNPQPPYPVTEWKWPLIDADQVALVTLDPDWLVIDVRSPERWRGEVEPIDPVAGHIPGTVNVFLKKNLTAEGRFQDRQALRELYEPLLGERPTSKVVVHCGSGVSACATLYALDRAGFPPATLYVGSFSQWCRSGRPVVKGVAG